eukprot:6639390-Alexandrium_andersonii.AAC.1
MAGASAAAGLHGCPVLSSPGTSFRAVSAPDGFWPASPVLVQFSGGEGAQTNFSAVFWLFCFGLWGVPFIRA